MSTTTTTTTATTTPSASSSLLLIVDDERKAQLNLLNTIEQSGKNSNGSTIHSIVIDESDDFVVHLLTSSLCQLDWHERSMCVLMSSTKLINGVDRLETEG
jgi:hypothetical protein